MASLVSVEAALVSGTSSQVAVKHPHPAVGNRDLVKLVKAVTTACLRKVFLKWRKTCGSLDQLLATPNLPPHPKIPKAFQRAVLRIERSISDRIAVEFPYCL